MSGTRTRPSRRRPGARRPDQAPAAGRRARGAGAARGAALPAGRGRRPPHHRRARAERALGARVLRGPLAQRGARAAARGAVRHPRRRAGAPRRPRLALRRVPGLDPRPALRGRRAARHPRLLPAQPVRAGAASGARAVADQHRARSAHLGGGGLHGRAGAGRLVHGVVHAGTGRGARARLQGRMVRASRAPGAAHRWRGCSRSSGRCRRPCCCSPCSRSPPRRSAWRMCTGSPAARAWISQEARLMGKVRVAIIGVGNCASSFVQGLHYYRNAKEDERVPGIMHVNLGGYHIRDVEFVAAIDIDKNKVGKDLAEAIVTWPNNTFVFAKVPKTRHHRAARHDPRRAGQVPLEDHPEGARLHGGHRQAAARTPGPTWWSTTCRWARRRPPSGTSSRCSRPAARSSTASRCSSRASSTGRSASRSAGCR